MDAEVTILEDPPAAPQRDVLLEKIIKALNDTSNVGTRVATPSQVNTGVDITAIANTLGGSIDTTCPYLSDIFK